MLKRRQQYQKGSVQKKTRGEGPVWVGRWREDGKRKSVVLGKSRTMTKSKARTKLDEILAPLNSLAGQGNLDMTIRQFLDGVYFPFYRRKWKESTRGTTEQRIIYHIRVDLGDRLLRAVTLEELQTFLAQISFLKLKKKLPEHLQHQ